MREAYNYSFMEYWEIQMPSMLEDLFFMSKEYMGRFSAYIKSTA